MAYQILQRTSPPTPKARALRSVMIPFEVEITATPIPFNTGWRSLWFVYTLELQEYLLVQIVLHRALKSQ